MIGDSPERRVEILADDDALSVSWARFGPRRDGADLHVHRRHADLFYVLEGELIVRLGREDASVTVPAGTLARVPPLVIHGFRNGSDADVRYLNLHAPGCGFGDYLRALGAGRAHVWDQETPPPDGVRPASDAAIGGAEVVIDRPEMRVSLLADADEIAIAEVRSGPAEPPPPHVHARHAESLYVLDGELELTLDGEQVRAPRGIWVQVAPGVAHAIGAPAPAHYLEIHAPSRGYGAFLRGDATAFDQG